MLIAKSTPTAMKKIGPGSGSEGADNEGATEPEQPTSEAVSEDDV